VFDRESTMVRSMDSSIDQSSSAGAPESGRSALPAKADLGNAEVQFFLGLQHGSALGEALDFIQAAQWYRKAADQDHVLAQYNLGVMFARGQGVLQNDVTAAGWMRKAAEGGDAGAQYDLGSRCHRASVDPLRQGAMESRIEAYKWFHLAAAQEYRDSVTACDRITINMTRAEVDEGNRRATAFVARKPASPQMQ
jgi:TPR repeat protein